MIAAIASATLLGATGHPVTVEVHVGNGLPGFQIVGLPDEACREARDRVRAAVLSSELVWPNRRITVNLAPSSMRKGGSGLDLAIAVGVLVASDALATQSVDGLSFIGELGLDGSLRSVPGVAPMVACLPDHEAVVAPSSWNVAAAVASKPVHIADSLAQLVTALRDGMWPDARVPILVADDPFQPDLADVRGQPEARAMA